MNLNDLYAARRSCRNFKENQKIDEKTLAELVELANQAPSWKNTQTSRYHFVQSPELMERLSKDCLPEYNRNNSKNAACYVVTSFVKDKVGFDKDGAQINELGNGWGIYDLGLHNMSFLLAAKERGIDSLILGLRDAEKLRQILQIPDEELIVSVIALGFEEETKKKPLRKEAEDLYRIH